MAFIAGTRLREAFLVLGLLCAPSAGARAQSFAVTHAKIHIVTEHPSLQPGHTAWIGVLFNLEKGWHIYWVNPGDSGAPPHIKWDLPPGFRTGEVRWPAPVRLGTGRVVDYGYQGNVLLALPLEVPASYKAGSPAVLKANVGYLICSNVCIPAKAQAELSIPSSGDAIQPNLFRATRESWPKHMPKSWKAQASDAGSHFILSIETGAREAKASFFPLNENEVDNAASQGVMPTPDGMRITLKKSDLLTKSVATLRGVVVLGPDRAFEIAAPVSARH
jgi:DsbC/DsbD-like thiol-disulfide interchange protein